MNSAARKVIHLYQPAPAPLLHVFRWRCWARAVLVGNGMMTLQDAVDELQEAAMAQGLVAEHGQDEIQRLMALAFARWAVT
jgi:hypothetical protein